jgi:hypothetical protein
VPVDPRFLAAFGTVFAAASPVTPPIEEARLDTLLLPPFDSPLVVGGGSGAAVESLPAVTVWRAADLANVHFRFVNLVLDGSGASRVVVRSASTRPGYLVAHFGPQHLLEQAFFDASGARSDFVKDPQDSSDDPPGGTEVPSYPVAARISGGSRIAFTVTDERILYSRAGLLDAMRTLPLSVAPHAEGATLVLDWVTLAGELGALDEVARREVTLRSSALRRISTRRGRPVEDGTAPGPAGRVTDRAAVRRAVGRAAVSRDALAEVTRIARLRRTAGVVDARFGASSAVAAVAEDLAAGGVIGSGLPIVVEHRPPIPREPTSVETAIELPWRLQLSPGSRGGFTHAVEAVERTGRIELWHTRLGTRLPTDASSATAPSVDDSASAARAVRAIWTRDFRDGAGPAEGAAAFPIEDLGDAATLPPFRSTLSARDRMQLVHLTSNHHYPTGGRKPRWNPPSVPVDSLMLSALGGWLASDVVIEKDLPPGLTVERWQHRATMGRDQYVKVVYSGVLLPFGHRASLVKVTERRVTDDDRATLYQRLFVVVREPERRFLGTGVTAHDNAMPFRWVRILTDATPPLAAPTSLLPGVSGQLFVPSIASLDAPAAGDDPPAGTRPFPFRMVANDVDNRLVEFEGPLIFAEKSVFEGGGSGPSPAAVAAALAAAETRWATYDMRGQRIAFAPPADPEDTTLATRSIVFHAIPDTKTSDAARNVVLPAMRVASAVVPAMSAFTGRSDPKSLVYARAYRASAFSEAGNAGGVFLELADAVGGAPASPSPMGFSTQADRSGAFLSPDVGVTALARKVGPIGGDLAAFAADPASFDAGGMFAALDGARLFGVLPLADLLPAAGSPVPRFITQAVNTVVALQQAMTRARTFVLTYQDRLADQGEDVEQAADELANAAEALADAVLVFSAPPHAHQDFEGLITALAERARTLRDALVAPVAPLGLPRPVIEETDALLTRIGDAGDDAAAVAELIERFYTGSLLPEEVSARLEWETPLVPWAPGGVSPAVFLPRGDATLRLVSEIQAPLRSGPATPTALVTCSLPPFTLTLLGSTPFIAIHVDVMEFSMQPGRKPDVNVELAEGGGIEFLGPLAFVETLKEIIPFDGFSDPPYLDVQASGLRAGFDLAIPDLAVGVFALTNVRLGAELSVPFIGESLEFRFFFSTRDDPFRLSVALFAGGGFFAITIAPSGLKMIEASFEFGAAVEMSFVVASGSLSVMAGIYFRLEIEGGTQSVQLTGFFRARGEVDVLGLISACIELYLELSYRAVGDSAKAVGKASISVEVSVCFLSFSVSVSCEKQFAGSSGDPTFVDAMGAYTDALGAARDPWSEYCAAFAPEPA